MDTADVVKKLQEKVTEEWKKMAKKYFLSEEIGGFPTEDLLNYIYIEPQSDIKVNDLLHNYITGNGSKKILVQADGGVGKSTLLAKIYKELEEKFSEKKSFICPLIYNLNGIEPRSISLEKLISLQGVEKSNYNCCQYIILIDGLDEIKNTDEYYIDEFFKSDFFNECKTIVACRKVFVQENTISKYFDEIITLCDYRDNRDKQLEMLEKFCNYTKTKESEINDEKKEKIKKYIEKNSVSLQNPLILGIFLLNMQKEDVPKESLNAGQILDKCVRDIIERECSKPDIFKKNEEEKEKTSKLIMTILYKISTASWKIYLNRTSKEDLNFDNIVEKDDTQDREIINKCLKFFISHAGEINEVIFDYFCAKYMFYVFVEEIEDKLDLFSVDHIKVEIKRFAFNDFMTKDQKKKAFKYLKKVYKQLNDNDYLRFLSLINFFPHIKKENKIKLIWFLLCEYSKLRKKNIYDAQKNLIEHCILQTGSMPWLEERYYKQMIANPQFDSFVRGGYLLYYAKSLPKDFKHPYFDEKRSDTKFSDWDRVFFEGFQNHIYEDRDKIKRKKRRRSVRRLEFRVAKQYIEERKEVAPEIAIFYKKLQSEDYCFKKAVEKEFYSLCETIRKYENASYPKD